MISPFRRGLAWYKYKRLENEFINATEYFPFEKDYNKIWSEHFSDLIGKIGNSMDSFFRTMLKDEIFDSYPHISELKESKRKKDINYFRDCFKPIYKLSGVEVEISYGLTFYEEKCRPFKDFNNNGVPKWWTAYNHIKHEWFDCIKEATLENTIEALAGLFVLNILHKESQEYLIKHENVIVWEYLRSFPQGYILGILKNSMIGIPATLKSYTIKAETPLFTHIFRVDESVG